jgi:CRP-like cAMP-binding protein
MARDTKLDQLANVRLFSNLTKKELAAVGRASDELEVDAGRILVREGATGHEFFLILDGEAVVKRAGRKIASLGPGQYFGELALLDRAPRNASVIADTPMRLLVLAQREFNDLLENVPVLAMKMLRIMAARLRDADAKAVTN